MLSLIPSFIADSNIKYLPIIIAVVAFLFFYKTIKFIFKLIFCLAILGILFYYFQDLIFSFL